MSDEREEREKSTNSGSLESDDFRFTAVYVRDYLDEEGVLHVVDLEIDANELVAGTGRGRGMTWRASPYERKAMLQCVMRKERAWPPKRTMERRKDHSTRQRDG